MKGKIITYERRLLGRIILSIFIFHFSISLAAHHSMVSIGVRGGGQTFLSSTTDPSSDLKGAFGATGMLDLRYTFYGALTNSINMGFTLGAGVGYGTSAIKGHHTDTYTNTDYLNHPMDYTVTSAFRQNEQFAKAEASLMLAFDFNHVIVNIGPRFMLPFATKTKLTLTETSIDAYYPQYKVHVTDELITGQLETPYSQSVSSSIPKYQVLMAAEVGYEWYFSAKSCLGVQLYADVAVWNKQSAVSNQPSALVQVAPITDIANPVPTVTVGTIDALIAKRRYLDFGIRLYYAFSVGPENNNRTRQYRDSRDHRNRYLWH